MDTLPRMPHKDVAAANEYKRRWVAARKAKWIEENGPCRRCGSWERPEVDHIDGALKVSSHIWTWATERRLAELAKCQVLCHDCHVTKTREAGENAHGETNGKAKLTDAKVLEMRRLHAEGVSYYRLGKIYGVSDMAAAKAVKGLTWKHLPVLDVSHEPRIDA